MARFSVPIPAAVSAAGLAVALSPVWAATGAVQVPNQFDGTWTIVATTSEGPCAASTSYEVRIKDSGASIPGDAVDIAGSVSPTGAVQATITRGANKVPISGSLDTEGSGSGTWRANGGLIACSGRWSARRSS